MVKGTPIKKADNGFRRPSRTTTPTRMADTFVKPEGEKVRNLAARVPESMHEEVRLLAVKKKISVQELVRAAIGDYLTNNK